MNIGIVTSTFVSYSGIDRVVEDQAKSLVKKGNKVRIITLKAELQVSGVTVNELGVPKGLLLQRIYRLLFFLDSKKINRAAKMLADCREVYSHNYPMNLIAGKAKKRYGATYIYYNHGLTPPKVFNNFFEKLYIYIITKLNIWSVRSADRAISISNYLARVLKKQTGITSTVVYNNVKRRSSGGIDFKQIKKKYHLNEGPIILFVGRISPHKGVHLLIRAFNKVKAKIPTAQLVLAGKADFGHYFKNLKKMSDNSVLFTGYISDEEVAAFYEACSVYATTTLWEGFDLPLAEAQLYGKPVVAFDLCSHPELVKNGLLVPPGQVDTFADSIITLVKRNEK